jgi:cysteine-rich repeat protein
MRHRRLHHYAYATLAAALLLQLCSSPGEAHQAPIPIAVWGGFAPAAVRCQRVISRTAAQCASTAWGLSDACFRAQLNGSACDAQATHAAIERAHGAALAVVEKACSKADFPSLGFATMVDIDIDVDVFCQELQDAMVSAIYGPALRRGVLHAVDDTTRACINATSEGSERLLHLAFRMRRRVLDYIANVHVTPSKKFTLIKRAAMNIQRAQGLLKTRLTGACPDFAAVYGRSSVVFLTLVAQRADCLSGRTYVQDYVVCPESICGNGMQEHAEQCDDGNTIAGDGCSPRCQDEAP